MSQLLVIGREIESDYRGALQQEGRKLGARVRFDSDFERADLCVAGVSAGREAASGGPWPPIVVMARDIGVDDAVALMRMGCADVIRLPRPPGEAAARALSWLPPKLSERVLEGMSPASQALKNALRQAARFGSSVLLLGETGTGKSQVARWIHDSSPRSEFPFVHVNCTALAPALIESEFFGHQRGAFTGASESHVGHFERAMGGSIFLDEIGDLPLSLQAKLLHVLEERRFERVGGSLTIKMNARVISATNTDLDDRVANGSFRADLFFRLNGLRFRLPALRDRLEDLPAIVDAGLQRICSNLRIPRPTLEEGVHAQLRSCLWPGNIRELLNVLERALVQETGSVLRAETVAHALERPDSPASTRPPTGHRLEAERESTRGALISSGGNVARAARRLGIPRNTLRYRIERLGLVSLIPRD